MTTNLRALCRIKANLAINRSRAAEAGSVFWASLTASQAILVQFGRHTSISFCVTNAHALIFARFIFHHPPILYGFSDENFSANLGTASQINRNIVLPSLTP